MTEARTCACGHDRHHHMVSARGKYTLMGWLWLMCGVTARPVRVEYWCRRCNQRIDWTDDPAVLEAHH